MLKTEYMTKMMQYAGNLMYQQGFSSTPRPQVDILVQYSTVLYSTGNLLQRRVDINITRENNSTNQTRSRRD